MEGECPHEPPEQAMEGECPHEPPSAVRKDGFTGFILNGAVERTAFAQNRVNIGFHRDPSRTCLVQNAAAL